MASSISKQTSNNDQLITRFADSADPVDYIICNPRDSLKSENRSFPTIRCALKRMSVFFCPALIRGKSRATLKRKSEKAGASCRTRNLVRAGQGLRHRALGSPKLSGVHQGAGGGNRHSVTRFDQNHKSLRRDDYAWIASRQPSSPLASPPAAASESSLRPQDSITLMQKSARGPEISRVRRQVRVCLRLVLPKRTID